MSIRRPGVVGQPRRGSNPFETPRMTVTVVGVEIGSATVMVRDTFGNEFIIDGTYRPKGTGYPVSGERWVLAKVQGRWVLDMQVGAPLPPVVDGDRAGMHPVVKQMLDAMATQGLVVDLTIDTDPVEPEDDETTDPSVPDPSDEEYLDGDLDDYPEEGAAEEAPVPAGSEPDDDKVPGSKVSDDLISAVTYNVAFWLGPKRVKKDLRRLYKQADVIALQECSRPERTEALEARPENWGMWRPANGDIVPILWNKDVFAASDGGSAVLIGSDGPATLRPQRQMNWIRLTHRKTGVSFWYVNTHMENASAPQGFFNPNVKPDSPRRIVRFKAQMAAMRPLMANLTRTGAVVVNADWNVNARADLRMRNPGLPTTELGRLGLRSNWDVLGPPKIGTIGRHGTVFDWHMLSNKVPGQLRFVSSKVLRGYRSDHRPVLTKIRIKDFA